ncbi:TonB-dependent receptor [Aquimarina sp. ERC-38]|uniref:TonB-dependent receptor n=1 Tax=Aquimarina sp. ERC-38 TaxID=2949996 RepID=UPI00224770E2|nr:TonB-dependent receptor plug domain-containing protein [Aquimarina sp. ERC-38]UZO80851.1 TonB-dependent receptor [Aquimarina sp. ERC-38]
MDQLERIVFQQFRLIIKRIDDSTYVIKKRKDNNKAYCAIVVDSVTRLPLPFTEVFIDNKLQTTTNSEGYFNIEFGQKEELQLSYPGYLSKQIVIDKNVLNKCDTIQLLPEIEVLNEVIITDYLTSGVEKNEDGSVRLSTKKLKILPGLVEPDILTSMQLLPGITSPTEDAAGLYIRGGTPSENLILFDGIKMYQTGHLFNQISAFNPYIIKSTKIYRGGTSVQYGDRISGVIDIKTDDNLHDSLVAGGGFNLAHADFYIKTPLSDKVGILGAFRRSTTDIYNSITINNLTEKAFQNTRGSSTANNVQNVIGTSTLQNNNLYLDTNFKLLWQISPKQTLKLSTLFAENRLNDSSVVNNNDGIGNNNFTDVLKVRNTGIGLNWQKQSGKNLKQIANFYGSFYDQRYNVQATNQLGVFTRNNLNRVKDIGGTYQVQLTTGSSQALHLGYEVVYNKTKYNVDSQTPVLVEEFVSNRKLDGKTFNHTLYSEYILDTPRLYTTLGIRNSYLTNTKSFFVEPRLFTSYALTDQLRITGSAELKNQQINNFSEFQSLDFFSPSLPISDNLWVLANSTDSADGELFNSSLPVLKSAQFTTGVLWNYKGWTLDIEGYYKNIKNIVAINNIPFQLGTSMLEDQDENKPVAGNEDRIGMDLLLKKTFKNYRIWVGYSLNKTSVKFPEVQEQSFANIYDQRHILNLSQTIKIKGFEVALGYHFASGRPFTQLINRKEGEFSDLEIELDPRGLSSSRLSDYHRWDLSGLYRFKATSKINIITGFSIRNIFNRRNTISQEFTSIIEDGEFAGFRSFFNESLRRTPDFVFRISF